MEAVGQAVEHLAVLEGIAEAVVMTNFKTSYKGKPAEELTNMIWNVCRLRMQQGKMVGMQSGDNYVETEFLMRVSGVVVIVRSSYTIHLNGEEAYRALIATREQLENEMI